MFQVKDIHIACPHNIAAPVLRLRLFYFQGWGRIIFFATYQRKKIFSTYRLGQIIFLGQKQRQIIFLKTLPAPPPDNEMVAPLTRVKPASDAR